MYRQTTLISVNILYCILLKATIGHHLKGTFVRWINLSRWYHCTSSLPLICLLNSSVHLIAARVRRKRVNGGKIGAKSNNAYWYCTQTVRQKGEKSYKKI